MKRFLVALLTLYCIVPARCAPPARKLRRADWALLSADAGMRGLDAYSTRLMLARGDRELVLPGAVAGSTAAMVAYSAGCVAVDYLAMRLLVRRHPRLARLAPIVDIGVVAPGAIHNLFLPRRSRMGLGKATRR